MLDKVIDNGVKISLNSHEIKNLKQTITILTITTGVVLFVINSRLNKLENKNKE